MTVYLGTYAEYIMETAKSSNKLHQMFVMTGLELFANPDVSLGKQHLRLRLG